MPVKSGGTSPGAVQQYLEHEFAAEISQHHQDKSGQCPVNCVATAPAETPATDQQDGVNNPRYHREYDMMRKLQRLAEKFVGKKHTTDERERQQNKSDSDHLEHDVFHHLHRRQCSDE